MILLLSALLPYCPLFSGQPVPQCRDSLLVVFWNVENFFDCRSESAPQFWTSGRFYAKCEGIAKTVMLIAERYGGLPDIIGFAEIETRSVIDRMLGSTLLRKADYRTVHFESPDHRGIDCGLIYRTGRLDCISEEAKHLYDSTGAVMPTRDILLVRFGELSVLVNHHPSKVGGGRSDGRMTAMARMTQLADSLMAAGERRILSIGDFNDDLWGAGGSGGTIKYNGRWEKIDGHFSSGDIQVKEEIFSDSLLLENDRRFGGLKPRRSFIGPRYNGGLSDHLPVVFKVYLLDRDEADDSD